MARYKPYDYDQALLLPVCLQEQLIPGTLEFAIHTLVESRMETSVFDSQFINDDTGRLAYDPKVLLKVVLVAYSRGIISSRRIEQACRENVTFMALACGQVPDHSTIAGFISSMRDQIEPLFRDVLLVCEEENLLGGITFALDGCKLPSNASREWSGTFSEGKILAADSNYHSQENLTKCQTEKIDAYIPDVNFRKRDPRFATQDRHKPEKPVGFTVEDFQYDEVSDRYLCPDGKVLRLRARKARIGDIYFRRYEAEERDCAICSIRDKCLESGATKRKHLAVALSEQSITLHRAMMRKIDTEEGRRVYGLRLPIVEPIFANLRIHKRLDRFTLRGKVKVSIQWLLYCMVHNIEKIVNYGYT
ncbi:MAG: transposase [Candidatus Eisenbacteria bacterium]